MAENSTEDYVPPGAPPSFGEELRREREMREITVREISESTKISTRFLEAIETGDLESLPAPVFTRGFIREYASYLGLEPEDIVDRYMGLVAREEQRIENEEAEMRERISGRYSLGGGDQLWRWIIVALIAVALLAGLVFLVSRSGESEPDSPKPPAVTEPVTDEQKSEQTVPAADSIEMTLSATEDSWVNLQLDEQPPIEFTIQSGSTRIFEAKEKIVFLTVGNAGGLNVVLNGVEMEPLGRTDQVVRDVEFDLEQVNELLRQGSGESPGSQSE